MARNLQNASNMQAEVGIAPPLPKSHEVPAPPNWTAIAAIFLSILSLIKSFVTDSRSAEQAKNAKFETAFGGPIRDALRAYDKHIRNVRVYTLASPKPVAELIEEITKSQENWLEAAFELTRLLSEADMAGQTGPEGWSGIWTSRTDQVEEYIVAMTDVSVTSHDELAQRARVTKEEMEVAVTEMKALLINK